MTDDIIGRAFDADISAAETNPEIENLINRKTEIQNEIDNLNMQLQENIDSDINTNSDITENTPIDNQPIETKQKEPKFDSYEDYEKWMKDKGVNLSEEEKIIPRKYQSDKYLADLKEAIIDANKARIAYEEAEAQLKIYKKESNKAKSELIEDVSENERIINNEQFKKNIREKDYQKNKGKYEIDNKGEKLSNLKEDLQEKKEKFSEKQKNLIAKLATDDYYSQFLEHKWDFPMLYRDMETGPKFTSDTNELLDSRPNEAPERTPKKQSGSQLDSNLENLRSTIENYIKKGEELLKEKEALKDRKHRTNSAEWQPKYKLTQNPEYVHTVDNIGKVNAELTELGRNLKKVLEQDEYYKDRLYRYGDYKNIVTNSEFNKLPLEYPPLSKEERRNKYMDDYEDMYEDN